MAKSVTVIGVPLDLGAGRRGVDMGPSAFRVADIHQKLRELGYDVTDAGDVPVHVAETREPGAPRHGEGRRREGLDPRDPGRRPLAGDGLDRGDGGVPSKQEAEAEDRPDLV